MAARQCPAATPRRRRWWQATLLEPAELTAAQVWLELDALLSSLADRTNDAPLGSKLGYALYSN